MFSLETFVAPTMFIGVLISMQFWVSAPSAMLCFPLPTMIVVRLYDLPTFSTASSIVQSSGT